MKVEPATQARVSWSEPVPVTPYHFGVGLLLKGAAPARVSVLTFMAVQVALDLEPGYYMLRGAWPFHRGLHTFALAPPAGVAVGLAMWGLGRGARLLAGRHAPELELLPVLLAGAVGAASHVILDAVMHQDVLPFGPFSSANPLLHLVSYTQLELLCLLFGIAGVVLWVTREQRPR